MTRVAVDGDEGSSSWAANIQIRYHFERKNERREMTISTGIKVIQEIA